MTTLILSSIIALLVIAGLLWAAVRIGKWIHAQSRSKRFKKPEEPPPNVFEVMQAGEEARRFILAEIGKRMAEALDNDIMGDKMVQDAKDILNKEA